MHMPAEMNVGVATAESAAVHAMVRNQSYFSVDLKVPKYDVEIFRYLPSTHNFFS